LANEAPSPLYHVALEASALVRKTTEPLLAELLDIPDAHDIFEWLRELSLMDSDNRGIFPHDMAREALATDIRWRNPDLFATLHDRARYYYLQHFANLDAPRQQQLLADYVYLHRDNPMVKPFFEWQMSGIVFTDQLDPNDIPELRQMVARFEGEDAAPLVSLWGKEQADGVTLLRGAGKSVAGYLQKVAVEKTTAEQRSKDAMVRVVWEFLQTQPELGVNETATLFRFWLARENYQAVSPVQSRLFLLMVQHYLTTPHLAYTFLPCSDPDFWEPVFAYADLTRVPALDIEIAGKTFGIYMRNWRNSPPLHWLEMMGQREMNERIGTPTTAKSGYVSLSQQDFNNAVKEALRHYHDPLLLNNNPLLQSHFLKEMDNGLESYQALQGVLHTAIDELKKTPRQLKLYRALYHTYVQPGSTQEAVAELLDVPFSSYRRHLKQGISYVTSYLWQQDNWKQSQIIN
jgi:hypothetical protein